MAQLDIVISNRGGAAASGGGAGATPGEKPGNTATAANRDSAVKQTATSVFAHRMLDLAKNSAKTLGKFAASQYGDLTGNYVGQRKIDNALSIAEGVISLGSSVVMGGISGGWVGVGVALISYATNATIGQIQASIGYSKQISRTNAIANYNIQRLGAILVDGNRG